MRASLADKEKSNIEKAKSLLDFMDKITAVSHLIAKYNQEFDGVGKELLSNVQKEIQNVKGLPSLDEKDLNKLRALPEIQR